MFAGNIRTLDLIKFKFGNLSIRSTALWPILLLFGSIFVFITSVELEVTFEDSNWLLLLNWGVNINSKPLLFVEAIEGALIELISNRSSFNSWFVGVCCFVTRSAVLLSK